jgi:transcriptional regulator with XRE-family HTH domain
MKQIDLVRDSGLPRGAISLYVSGKMNPKQAAIEKISKTLDVNALWLMGYDVPMTVDVDPETVRNQAIADIALRMQTDDRYRDVVIRLDKLDRKKLDAVAAIVESMQ